MILGTMNRPNQKFVQQRAAFEQGKHNICFATC